MEGIETSPLNFTGVVVGQVLETERHPSADRLCVAKVSDGVEEFQVVCGAPNCRAGMKTAYQRHLQLNLLGAAGLTSLVAQRIQLEQPTLAGRYTDLILQMAAAGAVTVMVALRRFRHIVVATVRSWFHKGEPEVAAPKEEAAP